jgi:hypothetical protein
MAVSVTDKTVGTPSSGSTYAIAKPASTVDGQLLIAHIVNEQVGSPAVTDTVSLAGWTQIRTDTSSGHTTDVRVTTLWKRASSEPSSYTFNFSGSTSACIGALVVVDAAGTSFQSNGANGAGSSLSSSGITPVANSLLMILTGTVSNVSMSAQAIVTSNPSWTEYYDFQDATPIGISMAYAIRAAATATGNATATASGSTNWAMQILSINPAIMVSVADTTTETDTISIKRTARVTIAETETTSDSITAILGSIWSTVSQSATSVWTKITRHN